AERSLGVPPGDVRLEPPRHRPTRLSCIVRQSCGLGPEQWPDDFRRWGDESHLVLSILGQYLDRSDAERTGPAGARRLFRRMGSEPEPHRAFRRLRAGRVSQRLVELPARRRLDSVDLVGARAAWPFPP